MAAEEINEGRLKNRVEILASMAGISAEEATKKIDAVAKAKAKAEK